MNRLSNILIEDEFNVEYNKRSSIIGDLASTKISAIGIIDDLNTIKSPFWDTENIFEI